MIITRLEYVDKTNKNTFILNFNDILTILVGVSGVGKTRVLNCINTMKKIAMGDLAETANIDWSLDFVVDGSGCKWSGQIENGRIVKESMAKGEEMIFSRDEKEILLEGVSVPKVSDRLSLLAVFWGVGDIKRMYEEIMHIYFININSIPNEVYIRPSVARDANGMNEESLGYTNLSIYEKMLVAYMKGFDVFEDIKDDYITVFPMVEDMKFDYDRTGSDYTFYLKEKTTDWISYEGLSSGMKKGLFHIAAFNMLPEGSILLIDEFENSMGTRCLDLVLDMLNSNERNYQIIVTSHHPYVINNVDMAHWQVVLRGGSRIYTKGKEELGLGRSHHEAFKQLMNLEEYTEGIFD
ncbi:MAG: ATP-binding protein [Clostridiaceae bacterium]|nr:ATP-binding protein [Clostridiaceae bacterium]